MVVLVVRVAWVSSEELGWALVGRGGAVQDFARDDVQRERFQLDLAALALALLDAKRGNDQAGVNDAFKATVDTIPIQTVNIGRCDRPLDSGELVHGAAGRGARRSTRVHSAATRGYLNHRSRRAWPPLARP